MHAKLFYPGKPATDALLPRLSACWKFCTIIGFFFLSPNQALAHGSAPIAPDAFWIAWEPNLVIILLMVGAHLLYGRGVFRLWRDTGGRRTIYLRHMLAFVAGEIVLAAALLSPLEPLSGTLFSAHMIQHVLLIAVAPPLLLLGKADIGLFLVFRAAGWRAGENVVFRSIAAAWRYGEKPLIATLLHGLIIWVWHVPAAFQAALDSDILHDLEHLTFFISALMFWRALFRAHRSVQTAPAGIFAALLTMLHGGFLGALIAFAQHPIYPGYVWTGLWGLSQLQDQQIAGLIMWVPTGLIYLTAGLVLAGRILSPERATGAATPHSSLAP